MAVVFSKIAGWTYYQKSSGLGEPLAGIRSKDFQLMEKPRKYRKAPDSFDWNPGLL